ncbi:MAG: hypothetical protein AB7F51_12315, partial [Pseudorhodoplanes sp.]
MIPFLSRYAAQLAFSLIGTVLGALVVTKLGLYSPLAQAPQPLPMLESPAEPALRRIEESHQAIRDRLDANQAEANRIAEAERRAKAEAATEAARAEEAARARAAALAAQERARKAAARAETAAAQPAPPRPPLIAAAPPVNIVPPVSEPPLTRGKPIKEHAGAVTDAAGTV